MFRSDSFSMDLSAAEVAICDLGLFQILVPTEKQWSFRQRKGLGWLLPKRKRVYRDCGWVFYDDQVIGGLSGLRLHPLVDHSPTADSSMVDSSEQLALGQPLSFEVSSQLPIPQAIANQALLLYQFNPSPELHHALFRNLVPQFVRIYPFRSSASLERLTRKFLREEKFIYGT